MTITGSGFTGATNVACNAAASQFTVNPGTRIAATVPAAASTEPIAMAAPGGTFTFPSPACSTCPSRCWGADPH